MDTGPNVYTTDNDFGYFCDPSVPDYIPHKKYDDTYRKSRQKYQYFVHEDTIYEDDDIESHYDEYSSIVHSSTFAEKVNTYTTMFIYGGIAVGSFIVTNILVACNVL